MRKESANMQQCILWTKHKTQHQQTRIEIEHQFFISKIKDDRHQLRKTQNFAYICLWQTTQTQSVVRVVNSRQALQTRSLQTRQGAPRFVMRPSSVLQRAQWRLDSCSRGGVGRLWLFCSNWYCCWYWICCCCCCCRYCCCWFTEADVDDISPDVVPDPTLPPLPPLPITPPIFSAPLRLSDNSSARRSLIAG